MSNTTVIDDRVDNAELLKVKKSWKKNSSYLKKSNNKPVLPVKGKKNILVTSTLLKVNNIPHFDDIIGSALSADVFARYCRMRGWNTLYVSGVNENGTEIEEIALKENLTPQVFCDNYFKIHKEIYEWLNINFDMFGRTSTPEQTKFVQEIVKEVHDKGYTTSAYIKHLLCRSCDRLLECQNSFGTCPACRYKYDQSDLRGDCDSYSTECLKHCNVFLNFSEMKIKLNEWVNRLNENSVYIVEDVNKSRLKDDLIKISITWPFKWGISILLEELESKVFNDWFTSPISYMNITAAYSQKWDQWWMPEDGTYVKHYQFMRKDKVALETVMFPTCLFATECNYTFENHILTTEYLKYEHDAFSKTLSIEAFANCAEKTGLSPDVFRFYLMFIRPESHDSSFNWVQLVIANNNELVHNLEKFCNRTLLMLKTMFKCVVPNIKLKKDDLNFLALVTRDVKKYIAMLDIGKLRDGLLIILSISHHCNNYISSKDLRTLIRGPKNKRSIVCTVIGLCCNMVCLLAVLLQPYMPQIASEIGKQINIDISSLLLNDYVPRFLQRGHNIGKRAPEILINHIRPSIGINLKRQFSQKQNENKRQKKQKKQKNKQLKDKGFLVCYNLNHISSIKQLEASISEQSDIIHILKQGNTEQSEVESYVRGLLVMKTKLDQMKVATNPVDTYNLNAEVSLLYPGEKQEIKEENQLLPEFDFATTLKNIKQE